MLLLHFQRPGALFALALLPVLAVLWRAACRRAKRAAEAAGGAAPSDGANAARGILRLAALAALITGLADPVIFAPGSVSSATPPVVFLLDVSASMAARDVAPDRLAAAKEAIRQACLLLPDARTALVATAGDAATRSSLRRRAAALLAPRPRGGRRAPLT